MLSVEVPAVLYQVIAGQKSSGQLPLFQLANSAALSDNTGHLLIA